MSDWSTTKPSGKKYSYAPRLFEYNHANKFTMQGKACVFHRYKNDLKAWAEPLIITADDIRLGINAANDHRKAYNLDADENLFALLNDDVDISRNIVAIYGCTTPWYAVIALAKGAKGVVIVSHRDIQCDDERIVCAKPDEVKEGFADYVISVCEMQAEGLGRFGRKVDANADVKAMDVCYKILKENGRLFLSLPCGRDMLVWNMGRIYGRNRLKLMMDGWTLSGTIGWDGKQSKAWTVNEEFTPLFILEKQ